MKEFQSINTGYNNTFEYGKLSIGIVVPIENYANSAVPTMKDHLQKVKLIDQLGFKALWLRDVPMHVPAFGDAGQTYDPFTYLGFLAGQTKEIALGIASVALPLHHPVHVSKSANTIDQLSGGRFILGIASGDRKEEYPATGIDFENRGVTFRDAYKYIRATEGDFPKLINNKFGNLDGTMDILPKPFSAKIPMLVTGHSQQSTEWIAENTDGWMFYPRDLRTQELRIKEWRQLISKFQKWSKPFMQPLYIDLMKERDFKPQGIHLGIRTGTDFLIEYLNAIKNIGVNHVALNLRFNTANIEDTLEQLGTKVLPHFHNHRVHNQS
jgi:luciferase-type oxidoreductase, BA3436 family